MIILGINVWSDLVIDEPGSVVRNYKTQYKIQYQLLRDYRILYQLFGSHRANFKVRAIRQRHSPDVKRGQNLCNEFTKNICVVT